MAAQKFTNFGKFFFFFTTQSNKIVLNEVKDN